MIKIILCSIACLSSIISFCQTNLELIESGNKAFYSNDYQKADSFYTEASKVFAPQKIIFINRGLTRMMLKDTCNACMDFEKSSATFENASIEFEQDIREIYYSFCISNSDTSYFDKNGNSLQQRTGYRYYEVKQKHRCHHYINGELHKKGYKLAITSLKYMNERSTTDIYALFQLIDTTKFYTYVCNYSSGQAVDWNIAVKEDQIKDILNKKYDFSSIQNKDRWMFIRLYLDSMGKIVDCVILDNNFRNIMKTNIESIQRDILDYLKEIPPIKGPKLFGQKVYFTLDFILGV